MLHAVAGPVDAATLIREAKWVVDTTKKAMKESKGDGAKFKAAFRKAHAEKLRAETGLAVEPITWDPPSADDDKSTLTFRDPSGRPLAPVLPPPPIDGPDVRLTEAEFNSRQAGCSADPNARFVTDKRGRRVAVNNQAVVHQLMAAHSMVRIERVYGTVFENVLGEKVSTKPVDVTPFPWVDRAGKQVQRVSVVRLLCGNARNWRCIRCSRPKGWELTRAYAVGRMGPIRRPEGLGSGARPLSPALSCLVGGERVPRALHLG